MSQIGTGTSKPTSPPGRSEAARGAIRTSIGASMHDEIAPLAFDKWQKRGCPTGDGQRGWFGRRPKPNCNRAVRGKARTG